MKCLEKERGRRYETANGLAMDIERHLDNEPIIAHPPSRLYEFQKTVRRHWVGFAATAAILLVLVVGVSVSTWQAVRATRAEHEQAQMRMDAEAALMAFRLGSSRQASEDGFGSSSNEVIEIEQALQRWPDQPQLWAIRASLLEQSGRFDDAIHDITRAIELLEIEPLGSGAYLDEYLFTRHRLLMKAGRVTEAAFDNCRARGIPVRDPDTPRTAIDLGAFYDAPLTESLHWNRGGPGNDLTGLLPAGVKQFDGRFFDVRGIISLQGSTLFNFSYVYPKEVTDIPVGLRIRTLHCLICTGWSEPDETEIGSLLLHYADGKTEKLPIQYGIHLRDIVAQLGLKDGEDQPLARGRVVWTGTNDVSRSFNGHLRLYVARWDNPRPAEKVVSVDFTTEVTRCALSMLAMTVEP